MGLFDRFRRRRERPRAGGVRQRPPFTAPILPGYAGGDRRNAGNGGFTVIDVETTGLSAAQHRVVEIAVVRTDATGRVTGEWSRRVDPEGPVGATHIHGITSVDVVGAPKFRDLIPHLNAWLAGTVVVAHNARFDLAFMRSEYRYAGWNLPWLPTLCTLNASDHYLPLLDRRRLADCCAAARVPLTGAHSALGDARATAALLAYYLNPQVGVPFRPSDVDLLAEAAGVVWPPGPTSAASAPVLRSRGGAETGRIQVKVAATSQRAAVPNLVELLEDFSLADALDEGAPAGSVTYLEKLAEVLEDGELSSEEAAGLGDVAATYELSAADREHAHRAFLLALCHLALDDGMVTRTERAELRTMAGLLRLPEELVTHTLDQAEAARHARLSADLRPLPAQWPHGEPLRVGDKVAFTGCDETQRSRLEQRAAKLGVRVMNNVSRRTAVLVTDGGFTGTKAAAAAKCGCRVVHPDVFEVLLQHLQPALPRHGVGAPTPAPMTVADLRDRTSAFTTGSISPTSSALLPSEVQAPALPTDAAGIPDTVGLTRPVVSHAVVRQWARDSGYQVSDRGRLPRELVDAYHAAAAAE
jgi:DNA polymerase III subunit epsilon